MIILGMRFALAPIVQLFTDVRVYVATVIKTLVFPLLVFLVLLPFEMDEMLRVALVWCCSRGCLPPPSTSIWRNFTARIRRPRQIPF